MFVIEVSSSGPSDEIVGAYLLARGLLTDPRSIAVRATTRAFDVPTARREAENLVDATYGLACIGVEDFGWTLTASR